MTVNLNYRERILIYSLLLLFMLIAYLPLSSLLFALKNDALTTNFPKQIFFQLLHFIQDIFLYGIHM